MTPITNNMHAELILNVLKSNLKFKEIIKIK